MGLSVCAPAGLDGSLGRTHFGRPSYEGTKQLTMISLKKKAGLGLVAAAAIGASIVALAGGPSASADPKQYTDPIFGFGSDTLQDVTNAFAGFSQGVDFTPLRTDNGKQIVSWDAFPANSCITTKVGTGQILRPNGSTNGLRALSATVGGTQWPLSGTLCGGPRAMGGIVDFARSSSAPTSVTNGPLQYIPAFKDALAFAYLRPSGSPVTSLTAAQLTALHATGPQLIGTTPVIACGIQTGSGTYASWMGNLGLATNGTGDPGTNICNNAGTAGRLQENNSPDLTAKGALLASMNDPICDGVAGGAAVPCTNAQLVVGYSASQFIARGNGVGSPDSNLGANGGLGAINGNAAVSGVAPNLAPVAAAYNDPTFGRTVFYIVDHAAVVGEEASPAISDMFVSTPGDPAKFCVAAEDGQAPGTTIEKHGFLQVPDCGVLSNTNRAAFRTT